MSTSPSSQSQYSSRYPNSFWQNAHRYSHSEIWSGSAEKPASTHSRPSTRKTGPSCLLTYKKLIETIVPYLMREGFSFVEAYDQVLMVGRLNPFITASQLPQTNPTVDREALLEFKAFNACSRLRRRYSRVLATADV